MRDPEQRRGEVYQECSLVIPNKRHEVHGCSSRSRASLPACDCYFVISVLSTYDVENMLITFMAIITGFLILSLIIIIMIRVHYKAKADELLHEMEIEHQAKKQSEFQTESVFRSCSN